MSAKSDAAAAAREDHSSAKNATGPRADVRNAENEVFGDDPNRERGIGSKYQNAPKDARVRLATAEARDALEQVISMAKSLVTAAERLDVAHQEIANVAASPEGAGASRPAA